MPGAKAWKLKNSRTQAIQSYVEKFNKAAGLIKTEKKKGIFSGVGDFLKKLTQNNKEKGKHRGFFGFFRWFGSKHSKTGRFGQKQARETDDTIHKLENQEGFEGKYFDPFKRLTGEDGENATFEKGTLRGDFAARVQEQMDLAVENDFEADRYGKEEQAQNALGVMKLGGQLSEELNEDDAQKAAARYGSMHDAADEFVPDESPLDGEPDNFEIELAVAPPPRFYLEYTKERTESKKREKRNKFNPFFKKDTEEDVIWRVIEKTPEYAQRVQEQRELDASYNPKKDEFFDELKNSVSTSTAREGHSLIRLIPRVGDKDKAIYSFGYYPVTLSGIAGVVEGEVKNPDSVLNDDGLVKTRYPVSYSNFLRAVAKIRGIKGSPRTYSITGYNCTSFAIDIAKEAGVDIPDERSTVDITTFVSHSQRVDMPAILQQFLKDEKKTESGRRKEAMNVLEARRQAKNERERQAMEEQKKKQEEKRLEREAREQRRAQNKEQAVGYLLKNPLFMNLYGSIKGIDMEDIAGKVYDEFDARIKKQDMKKIIGIVEDIEEGTDDKGIRQICLNLAMGQPRVFEQVLSFGGMMPLCKTDSPLKAVSVYSVDYKRVMLRAKLSNNSAFCDIYGIKLGDINSDRQDNFLDSLVEWLNIQLADTEEVKGTTGKVASMDELKSKLDNRAKIEQLLMEKIGSPSVEKFIMEVCSNPEKFREIYHKMRMKAADAV